MGKKISIQFLLSRERQFEIVTPALVEAGRDLQRTSGLIPLFKQGHWELARTTSRWLLSISKEGDYTASLGNLFLCSVPFTQQSISWHWQGSSVSVFAHCLNLPLAVLPTSSEISSSFWWEDELSRFLPRFEDVFTGILPFSYKNLPRILSLVKCNRVNFQKCKAPGALSIKEYQTVLCGAACTPGSMSQRW